MADQASFRTAAPPPDDLYARSVETGREPPVGVWATVKHLGPGIILLGGIVGSGELIMTTKLGAEVGYVLLWFVLLSCVIKVVVQAELARHTISSGRTFLEVFNSLPGPRGRRPTWLTLEWLSVVVVGFFAGLAVTTRLQRMDDSAAAPSLLRDILINVGPFAVVALVAVLWAKWTTSRPSARPLDEASRPQLNWFMWLWLATVLLMFVNGGAILGAAGQVLELALPGRLGEHGAAYWAILVAVVSGGLVLSGGYRLLEQVSMGMVATFTLATILCTCLLQWTGNRVTWANLDAGLRFALPSEVLHEDGGKLVALTAGVVLTALAMYAGTGIGTGEMMAYTYWCVEKGYARNAGERQPGEDWRRRAKGWVRVMYVDVLVMMVMYTVSTVCFYFLGAAILHAKRLNPDEKETLSTLQAMYTLVLEEFTAGAVASWATTLFIVGAFIVLFSTVLAGAASSGRILADGLCVVRIIDPRDFPTRRRFIRIFVVLTLTLQTLTYALFENPPAMLVISSMVAVAIYPVLGLGTLWLRYRDVDPRITPSRLTSGWLWVCCLAVAVISPTAAILAVVLKLI